jgi:hypothetical protein
MKARSIVGGLWLLALVTGVPAHAQRPQTEPWPTGSDVRVLRERLDVLGAQIERLASASDTDADHQGMQQNWRALQDYMGWMHARWGTGPPWMLGPDEMVQGPSWLSCPALGGSGAAWPPPEGMTPRQYGQQMREHLSEWREQLDQLAQAQDPARRQRLAQEHWQELYRDMQTARGLGWMWGGPMKSRDALGPGLAGASGSNGKTSLPDPDSPGARLVGDYCTQCHVAPAPTLHTKDEWANVVGRMHVNLERRASARIRAPDDAQWEAIFAYMQQHAR